MEIKYYVIMTITSTHKRKRSSPVTWDGEITVDSGHPEVIYISAYKEAIKKWKCDYRGISNEGFVVDFYHKDLISI